MGNGLQTERGTKKAGTVRGKPKTKKCPNCGQKTVINDIAECKFCGWPLSAKTINRPTQLRNVLSNLLIILAILIAIFILAAYQGTWKHVVSIPLDKIHNSPTWLIIIGISIVSVLLVLASRYIIGYKFPSVFKRRIYEYLIIAVIYPTTSAAILLYYIRTFAENAGSQFELSIVSATIGGLVLVSGFIGEGKSALAKELINAGRWFLIASVFGTLFALFMPFLKGITNPHDTGYNLFFALTAATLILATLSFAWAVSLLLPRLWRLGR